VSAHDKRTLDQRLEWIANWSEPDIDLADAGTCREALDKIRSQAAEIQSLRAQLDASRRIHKKLLADLIAAKADGDAMAEALRDMADIVATYAMQPLERTRQRDNLHQDQWDQITQVCGEMLTKALAKRETGDEA